MYSTASDPTCPDCIWAFTGEYQVVEQTGDCEFSNVNLSHGIAYYSGYGYVFMYSSTYSGSSSWNTRGLVEWDGQSFEKYLSYDRTQVVRYYGTAYYE